MIEMNVRSGQVFADYYKVIASAELSERGHEDDPRFGVSIEVDETPTGKLWSTHEYNAEKPNEYYWGHYFMRNEGLAWQDFFERCAKVNEYAMKWEKIKAEEHD